jgi:hypothetical protein
MRGNGIVVFIQFLMIAFVLTVTTYVYKKYDKKKRMEPHYCGQTVKPLKIHLKNTTSSLRAFKRSL